MSKILIVEDEEAIADLEKDYLELSGFEVEIENRGDTGLNKALDEEFDLLILDLMLPEVDGFEICRQVRLCKEGRYRQDPGSWPWRGRLHYQAVFSQRDGSPGEGTSGTV